MRKLVLVAAMLSLATPALAQDDDGMREGFDLLGEGSRMILEGLLEGMRPMMEEARPFFEEEVLPMLEGLAALVDDLGHYEAPERLPNGDILIRRSPDAPPWGEGETAPEVGEGGEVEL